MINYETEAHKNWIGEGGGNVYTFSNKNKTILYKIFVY